MSHKYGYSRVSHSDQNSDRQLEGLKKQNVVYIYSDKTTGVTADRPELNKLLQILRPGDEVVVLSFDRLARSLPDLLNIIKDIHSKGAVLFSIKENVEFTTDADSVSKLYLNIMGAVAEFERAFSKERQREGIEIAKDRGAYKGGVRKLSQADRDYLYDAVDRGVPKTVVAKKLKIMPATVYSYLKLRDDLKALN